MMPTSTYQQFDERYQPSLLRSSGAFVRLLRVMGSLISLTLVVFLWGCGGSNASTTGGGGSAPTATPSQASSTSTSSTTTSTATASATTATTASSGSSANAWNAVLIAQGPAAAVTNYDPLSGKHEGLTQTVLTHPTFYDVAPSGKNEVYEEGSNGQVQYFTLLPPNPRTNYFYQLPAASAGNAIWTADSRHVLILARNQGVMEVDTQTGQAQNLFSLASGSSGQALDISRLSFYRNGYLYFVGGGDGPCALSLCRIGLNGSNAHPQSLSTRQEDTLFWMSPDGSTIYYYSRGFFGANPFLIAENSDGTNSHTLRPGSQFPIGFASDGSLMVVKEVSGKFQVVKLGTTAQQDQVVLPDAAPGAASLCDRNQSTPQAVDTTPICDNDIALAPYGQKLVVQATAADKTSKVWFDNLATGKQSVLLTNSGNTPVTLIGWDQLPVCAGGRC